jgi:hypothetical protein
MSNHIISTSWLIKVEMLSHQTQIVLRKCAHIKALQSCLKIMQSDCERLFLKMVSEELVFYLEWFASVIFHILAEIDHLQTGRIFDLKRFQNVEFEGWLHKGKNTHFFAVNSVVDDENTIKLSIMSFDGQNHAVLETLTGLHDDLHSMPELCNEIQSKVILLEVGAREARKELQEILSDVHAVLHNCSFWQVNASVHPLESVTCHVNIKKGILSECVFNRIGLKANLRHTREYIEAHLMDGRIPNRLNRSQLTAQTLIQDNTEEEISHSRSWKLVQARFACEKLRLTEQRTRIINAYLREV